MKPKCFAFTFLLIMASLYLNSPQALISATKPSQCVVGRTAAPFGFWTWPANSHVKIYLRESQFSESEAAAVKVAAQNWDVTARENGSNVHFSFLGFTRESKTAQGDLTLIRGDVYDKKMKHLALLQAHSLRSNQLIDSALIIVDFRVKNPDVLTNVMAHELGHSLGLLDCPQCNQKSTAMGLLKTGTEPNGINGPTACDTVAVLAAYQDLKLHVRPAPTILTFNKPVVDPGEDPEADDTPIVRRP
jgi:hypothetical protein